MRIYKSKAFSKWASQEGLSDISLRKAVEEIERGLVDADLGGYVIKNRVALGARGKSGGARTLLAYKAHSRTFFLYGFAKNVRSNVKADELKALRRYAAELMSYSKTELDKALIFGALIEVKRRG